MSRDERKPISGYEKFMQLVRAEMLKVYSENTVEHALNPRNRGSIKDADGYARVTGPCGDTMEIFLKVKGNRVIDATFLTDGCGMTLACGSVVTEMVKCKNIAEVQRIDSNRVLEVLGGLPEPAVHCSVLATNTLKAAIENLESELVNKLNFIKRKSRRQFKLPQ